MNPVTPKGYILNMDAGGVLRISMAPNAPSVTFIAGSGYDDGNWHFVGVTIDRDSATGVKIYADGVQIGSDGDCSGIGNIDNTANFNIGWLDMIAGSYFNGSIADVRIYDRALNKDEIKQLFLNPYDIFIKR